MCLVMNAILYAFLCRHMVYYFMCVGGFQDLAPSSKLRIHPLYIAAGCVVLYLRAGFLCAHNLIIVTYTLYITLVLTQRGHWEDPDVDGRIILRWIFRKWEGVENGWSWLRIGTGGGHL